MARNDVPIHIASSTTRPNVSCQTDGTNRTFVFAYTWRMPGSLVNVTFPHSSKLTSVGPFVLISSSGRSSGAPWNSFYIESKRTIYVSYTLIDETVYTA